MPGAAGGRCLFCFGLSVSPWRCGCAAMLSYSGAHARAPTKPPPPTFLSTSSSRTTGFVLSARLGRSALVGRSGDSDAEEIACTRRRRIQIGLIRRKRTPDCTGTNICVGSKRCFRNHIRQICPRTGQRLLFERKHRQRAIHVFRICSTGGVGDFETVLSVFALQCIRCEYLNIYNFIHKLINSLNYQVDRECFQLK